MSPSIAYAVLKIDNAVNFDDILNTKDNAESGYALELVLEYIKLINIDKP